MNEIVIVFSEVVLSLAKTTPLYTITDVVVVGHWTVSLTSENQSFLTIPYTWDHHVGF